MSSTTQSNPSRSPSPVTAEHGMICEKDSREACMHAASKPGAVCSWAEGRACSAAHLPVPADQLIEMENLPNLVARERSRKVLLVGEDKQRCPSQLLLLRNRGTRGCGDTDKICDKCIGLQQDTCLGACVAALRYLEQLVQLCSTVLQAPHVSAVHDPHQSIRLLVVISPVGSQCLLPTNVPDVEAICLVLHSLHERMHGQRVFCSCGTLSIG